MPHETMQWTREREIELAQKMEAGREAREQVERGEGPEKDLRQCVRDGVQAREAFIVENMPLVRSRVLRMLGKRTVPGDDRDDLEELVQEATPALINAVDKFDWRTGAKFSTYAVYWIDGAIKRRFERDRRRRTAEDATRAA